MVVRAWLVQQSRALGLFAMLGLTPGSIDRGSLNGYLNSALVLGLRGAWLGPEQHISGGQRDEFDHMLKSAVEVMDSQAYNQ